MHPQLRTNKGTWSLTCNLSFTSRSNTKLRKGLIFHLQCQETSLIPPRLALLCGWRRGGWWGPWRGPVVHQNPPGLQPCFPPSHQKAFSGLAAFPPVASFLPSFSLSVQQPLALSAFSASREALQALMKLSPPRALAFFPPPRATCPQLMEKRTPGLLSAL